MKNLENIISQDFIRSPHFHPDNFQRLILDQIHLEFFFEKCRFLITPQLGYLVTGEATPEEEELLQNILEEKQEQLDRLKEYLIYNLSLYSALLETNSYFIALNGHLIIARFIQLDPRYQNQFEIKLYTIGRNDLPENYKDKIYLGRDFISLTSPGREHFGLRYMRDSVQEQLRKLRIRIMDFVPPEAQEELSRDYIQEMEELVGEMAQIVNQIIESFPVDLSSRDVAAETLIQANMLFRDVKHILIEIEETARELEQKMFDDGHSRAVRYVTKFKKDLTNDINYLTFKVNGRISDHVNGIHF